MKIYNKPNKLNWPKILKRPALDYSKLEEVVKPILGKVKKEGDLAVSKYAAKFDGFEGKDFLVGKREIETAEKALGEDLKKAIRVAAENIEKFHSAQASEEAVVETMPGVRCWRKSVPIERVGLYIPGGTAPLFSTVLMLGIPAKLAACRDVILCTPPDKKGRIHPAILFVAELVGITQIFKVGGAQAIAAMAYGTQSIPRVYKIFGPGNQYVTAAKQLLSMEGIAIDLPAGPSEVLVVADSTAKPSFVAADLLSQAEHGLDSQVVLVAFSEDFVQKVMEELLVQLKNLPRKEIAGKVIEKAVAVILKSESEALDLVNEYAPEHLIVNLKNADEFAAGVFNAGSIFLGNFSPESVGDYASGTNHTLPTNGFAKAFGGVSLDSFVKKITYQKLTKKGLENIAQTVEHMAEAEGLMAHKNAVSIRLLR